MEHVDHPGSVVSVGDEIEVQVLDIDMSRERISSSSKLLKKTHGRSLLTATRWASWSMDELQN